MLDRGGVISFAESHVGHLVPVVGILIAMGLHPVEILLLKVLLAEFLVQVGQVTHGEQITAIQLQGLQVSRLGKIGIAFAAVQDAHVNPGGYEIAGLEQALLQIGVSQPGFIIEHSLDTNVVEVVRSGTLVRDLPAFIQRVKIINVEIDHARKGVPDLNYHVTVLAEQVCLPGHRPVRRNFHFLVMCNQIKVTRHSDEHVGERQTITASALECFRGGVGRIIVSQLETIFAHNGDHQLGKPFVLATFTVDVLVQERPDFRCDRQHVDIRELVRRAEFRQGAGVEQHLRCDFTWRCRGRVVHADTGCHQHGDQRDADQALHEPSLKR